MARPSLRLLVGALGVLALFGGTATSAQEAPTETVLVTYGTEGGLDRALADDGVLSAADATSEELAGRVAVAELTAAEAEVLRASPGVLAVEPDAEVHAADVPNDPCYTSPSSCGGSGPGAWHVDRIGLPGAWDLSHGGGVTVAVLDSGVGLLPIQELQGKLLPEIDATGGPGCLTGPDLDHGTEVAAVIGAATSNGAGTAGVGWDVKILPVRVWTGTGLTANCNGTSLSYVINGVTLARNAGARIINLSLSTTNATALRAVIDDAVNAGVVVVAAAGNSGSPTPDIGEGGYPAFYPNVISVGASCPAATSSACSGQVDSRASFSNFGSWVDLYAPGVDLPTFRKLGSAAVVSGTSFAAPVTAGVVALLRAVRPNLTPAQISDILLRSADPVGGLLRLDARGALYDAVFRASPAVGAGTADLSSSTVEVAARADNGQPMVRSATTGGGGSRWAALDGYLLGDPDLIPLAGGNLAMVGRGGDRAAYFRVRVSGSWTPWVNLGGQFTSDLSVVSSGPNRVDIFGRGLDGAMWTGFSAGQGFTGWSSLGGGFTSEPDAASWAAGRLDVFARGLDGAMWHRAFGGTWFPWESLGGGFLSGPGAVSWGPDVVHVVARGLDNQLYLKAWTGTGYTGWVPLGGVLVSSPDLSTFGPGTLDVYARAGDSQVWRVRVTGSPSGWAPIS